MILHCITRLGIAINAELTFAMHVKWVSVCCFYQLRQLCSIRPVLSADNTRMLVHALIASRLMTVIASCTRSLPVHLRPFQSVLNAAAPPVVKKWKLDSITPTLHDDFYWLLVQRQRLRSASSVSLAVRRTRLSTVATERFLLRPPVCGSVFHYMSPLLHPSPFFTLVLNLIFFLFVILISDSLHFSLVQYLCSDFVISDTIIVITLDMSTGLQMPAPASSNVPLYLASMIIPVSTTSTRCHVQSTVI